MNFDFKMGSWVTFLKSGVKKGFCYVFSIWAHMLSLKAFLGGANGKESACQFRRPKRHEFDPRIRKIPWSRKRQATSVFFPEKFRGQWSLVGYCPGVAKSLLRVCTHSCIKHETEKDSHPGQSYEWVNFRGIIDLLLIRKEGSSSTSIRMFKSPSQLYTRNLIQNNCDHAWGSTTANFSTTSVKLR